MESKQAAGAPGPVAQGRDPSRGHVNDCQTSISGKLTHSLGVPTCVDLGVASHGGYQVLAYNSGSVPLAWEGGQGVFHSTVGNSYSQGRVVEPHKEGYPVYGASQQRSVRGEGHVMNSTSYWCSSDWGHSPLSISYGR